MIIIKPISTNSLSEMSRSQLKAKAQLMDERLRAAHEGRFGAEFQDSKLIKKICRARDEFLDKLNNRPPKEPVARPGGRLLTPAEHLEKDFRATLSDISRNSGMLRSFAARTFTRFITPQHCPSPLDEELVFLRAYPLDPDATSPDVDRPEPEQFQLGPVDGINLSYTRWEQVGQSMLTGFVEDQNNDPHNSDANGVIFHSVRDYELPQRAFDVTYEVSTILGISGVHSAISNNFHGWRRWASSWGGQYVLREEKGLISGDELDLPDESWPLFDSTGWRADDRSVTELADAPFTFTTPVISPSDGRRVMTIQYSCVYVVDMCRLDFDVRFLARIGSPLITPRGNLSCIIRRA